MGIVDNAELARVILGDSTEFHVWDRGSIATLMAEADVALAPLFTDCQFASAKPPHKAIIYNYMKLPVIASPTEEYKLYIEEGLNGFIASTSQEWVSSLEFLYKNPDKRVEMGACGHARAQGYSIEKIGSRLLNLFLHVCSSATAPN